VGSLGARLKALRSAAGLSQCELSRRTGLSREQISRYEHDRVPPTWPTLAKLIRVLGVRLVAVAG
jgi:transcriptional regulator with XRE-family HTH domain